MIIRNTVVAGTFYPYESKELRDLLDKFNRQNRPEQREVLGAVAPHAGYIYCGNTLAQVYGSIPQRSPSFVILGPNHTGLGKSAAIMSRGIWKTPLGNTRIDGELADSVKENTGIEDDISAHSQEHSIEVQLPWIQNRFGNVKFVPVSLYNQSQEDLKEIGEGIRKAIKQTGRNTIVIASSDFTHYGVNFGYTPVTGGPGKVLRYIERIDKKAVNAISMISPESFGEVLDDYRPTICGSEPINAMLYALKNDAKKGELLDYRTTYDVSRDINTVVSYAGVVLE